jgi:hypothetical protein
MNNTIEKEKTAITSYLGYIGVFIAMSMNSEDKKATFASFHIRQGWELHLSFHRLNNHH